MYCKEGGKEEVSPPEPGNSTSVEVTKLLEPFTNYSFYVRVWNNHGASDQSTTIVCSTAPSGTSTLVRLLSVLKVKLIMSVFSSVPKGAPKVHVNVISSTKLNVSWEPLTKRESRGIVVQYKLQCRQHQHPFSRILLFPAEVQSYILSGTQILFL